MNALAPFHFLAPQWLWLLLALPPLLWLLARRDVARQELSRLVDAELLPHLLSGTPRGRALPLLLFGAGWLIACLALAGPSWSRVAQPLYAQRPVQVVAISMSRHMLSHDQSPSRLDRARYKARALFQANAGGLNGLIAYAGQSFVVAPLTEDAHSIDDLLDALSPDTMPVDGNDAAAAIAQAVGLIRGAKAASGSLVLITDQADDAAVDAARRALAEGVHVSVLGVGTPQGQPIALGQGDFVRDAQGQIDQAARDDRQLAAVAAAGGGRFAVIGDGPGDVQALHAELADAQPVTRSDQAGEQWQDRGPWLLLLLLPLAALAFRRGWLLVLPLLISPLLWSPQARADGWRDLWLRPDQQAAQALAAGRAKQAQQLARDPALRGAAAYRAGDYAAAAQDLTAAKGSDGAYNRGNALAKQQRYQQAISAYDEALKLNPHNADAAANRKVVEDWLKRQQAANSPQNKQQGQNQQSQNQQGQNQQGQDQQGQNQQGQNQQGQNQQGQNQQGQNQLGQNQQGQNQQGQNQQGQNQQGQNQQGQNQQGQNQQGQNQQGQDTPEQQAAQRAQAEQAQQALRQQLDQQLAGQAGKEKADKDAHQLGRIDADDPQAKLPQELRQALQRVPDDPGALLRRKFELEYRQRQGDLPAEDQP